MRRILLLIPVFLFFQSCKNEKKSTAKTDDNLVTEESWGPIKRSTPYEKLITLFGAENVRDSVAYGPEGLDSVMATFIYPGQNREMVVYWSDSLIHQDIGSVETYQPGSPYHTATGLKTGSTLQDLLAVNGQQINFYGFGWDYGGTIISYNNGPLQKSSIGFRLDADTTVPMTFYSDSEFNTSMPEIKDNLQKIVVSGMILRFNEH